jgi:MFS family permease
MASAFDISTRKALHFVVLLGVVSLFADMTYEGARSITGPFLAVLGASGAAVGVVAGLGELIGYGLRLVSGHLADRTGRYWLITWAGYALNVAAVPLLALAGRWETAAVFMVAERIGKAVRTPARDAMLSHATHRLGHGFGFGLHEALDQTGAVCGPLSVALVLAVGGGYPAAFAVLVVPAAITLGVLSAAWRLFPHPQQLEEQRSDLPARDQFPRTFWLYAAASGFIAAGFVDWPLVAYHLQKQGVIAARSIPIFYAVAMGTSAAAALVFGRLFDRVGSGVIGISVFISALCAPLVFLGGPILALLGIACWGIGMGAQESVLRAMIAGMVSAPRRGAAYGVFNASFGAAWFAGSALLGVLYDVSLAGLVAFSIVAQLAALPLLALVAIWTRREAASAQPGSSGGGPR